MRSPSVTDDDVDRSPNGKRIVEQLGDAMPVGPRHVEAVLAAIHARPLLAGQPDRRGVDDRQELLEVVGQEPVEQHRVVGLQCAQEDVAAEVAVRRVVLGAHTLQLRVQVFDDRRQQSVELEKIAFLGGEGGALVVIPVGEQLVADEHQLLPSCS